MTRDVSDRGVLAMLVAAMRAHVVETVLITLAAAAFLLGLVWHDEPTVGMPVFAGEQQTDAVDATFVSTLLQVRDGAWIVRESDTLVLPTAGHRTLDVVHAAGGGLLFPEKHEAWTVGGPLLRRRVPEWQIESAYRVLFRAGSYAVRMSESQVAERGWGIPTFHAVTTLDAPTIATGFNPLGRPMSYAPEQGRLLHVAVLASEDAGDLTDVDAWRALVAGNLGRLAEAAAYTDSSTRAGWWRGNDSTVISLTALAAVLRVPDSVPALTALREDLDRDLTPRTPGGRFYPQGAQQAIDGALALLSTSATADDDTTALIALVQHFVVPRETLDWLTAIYADAPVAALLDDLAAPNSAWTPPPRWLGIPPPPTTGLITPLLLLGLIGVAAYGGTARLRGRDVFALMGALLFASLGRFVAPHVTVESLGLMATALIAAWWRRRGAVALPRGVPRAFAIAALLLPLADVLRLPLLDATARVVAFVGIAYLAVGALDRQSGASDAPRRAGRRRHTLWTSLQLLAVTGAVLGLLLAMLDPTSWAKRAPSPKWIVIGAGLVLALTAGIFAFARRDRTRPLPAAVCALALGAAIHLTCLVISPFPRDKLSGEGELRRIGMLAATVAAVFALGRVFVLVRAHRELRTTDAAADHHAP